MSTLSDWLWRSVTQHPEASAVVWSHQAGGGGVSYLELQGAAIRGAACLRGAGLRTGDKVVLAMESRPEWPMALLSILEAELVVVPIPAETPAAVVARIAAFAEAKAAIVGDRSHRADSVLSGIRCFPVEELFGPIGPPMASGSTATLGSERQRPSTSLLHDATTGEFSSELAILAFTSGSTDQPRGVELSHANVLSNLQGLLALREAHPGDSFLSMLPPAHLFELTVGLLAPLLCGARVVFPGSMLPNRLTAALLEDQITHALCVPALLDALYVELLDELVRDGVVASGRRGQSPAETARRLHVDFAPPDLERLRTGLRRRIGGSLHTLIVGGAAVDPAWKEIAAALELRLEVGYGLTEASPIVSLGLAEECPSGSVGRPLPGVEVRLGPDDEIQVRGPGVMHGYFKDPELTTATLVDGWLRTGDCGSLDENGFLFIIGRLKEAIVSATGETIYPEEAEPYYASPLFSEFCVAGLRGPHGNDVPALFAVPVSSAIRAEDIREAFESLRAIAPSRLRVQRLISMTGPLPRTSAGKVRRRSLAQRWSQAND